MIENIEQNQPATVRILPAAGYSQPLFLTPILHGVKCQHFLSILLLLTVITVQLYTVNFDKKKLFGREEILSDDVLDECWVTVFG